MLGCETELLFAAGNNAHSSLSVVSLCSGSDLSPGGCGLTEVIPGTRFLWYLLSFYWVIISPRCSN